MGLLKRIPHWLRKIPIWVWVFLTLTQVLSVAASSSRLYHLGAFDTLEGVTGRTPEDQAVIEDARETHREFYDRYQRTQWTNIIGGSVLAPIFFAIGYWRWRSGKPKVDPTFGVSACIRA